MRGEEVGQCWASASSRPDYGETLGSVDPVVAVACPRVDLGIRRAAIVEYVLVPAALAAAEAEAR